MAINDPASFAGTTDSTLNSGVALNRETSLPAMALADPLGLSSLFAVEVAAIGVFQTRVSLPAAIMEAACQRLSRKSARCHPPFSPRLVFQVRFVTI